MNAFLLTLAWFLAWVSICLLPACKGYDSTISVSLEDRLGRINAGITIHAAPNDK